MRPLDSTTKVSEAPDYPDYSEYDQPISTLFPVAENSDTTKRFLLDREQVDFFNENGYLAGVEVLNQAQLDALRSGLMEFIKPEHPGRGLFYEYHENESADPSSVVFHALGAWRINEAFHDLLWNAAYLIPAAQLLGGAVRFWHDQIFYKPAKHGGVVAWHQDYSYWTRTTPMAHLTCWIALDDSKIENGCLHYVPGSHRWPDLPRTALTGEMDALKSALPAGLAAEFDPVPIELKAGQCSFHHPRMLHGSYGNHSAHPRRATLINVMRDGVRSNSNVPLLEGVPVIAIGEQVSGRFFPLLLKP